MRREAVGAPTSRPSAPLAVAPVFSSAFSSSTRRTSSALKGLSPHHPGPGLLVLSAPVPWQTYEFVS